MKVEDLCCKCWSSWRCITTTILRVLLCCMHWSEWSGLTLKAFKSSSAWVGIHTAPKLCNDKNTTRNSISKTRWKRKSTSHPRMWSLLMLRFTSILDKETRKHVTWIDMIQRCFQLFRQGTFHFFLVKSWMELSSFSTMKCLHQPTAFHGPLHRRSWHFHRFTRLSARLRPVRKYSSKIRSVVRIWENGIGGQNVGENVRNVSTSWIYDESDDFSKMFSSFWYHSTCTVWLQGKLGIKLLNRLSISCNQPPVPCAPVKLGVLQGNLERNASPTCLFAVYLLSPLFASPPYSRYSQSRLEVVRCLAKPLLRTWWGTL